MRELRMAVLGDIHLGHPRNRTTDILSNLRKAFPDNAETAALDLILIDGDVFDGLLDLSNPDVWEIKIWVSDLMRLCKKHDIKLRVLEGTPSHDYRQSEMFPTINITGEIGCDLQYVTTLSIEYIADLGIHILYVPDEWDENPDETLRQVKNLMNAKGLSEVDFALMHGAFPHQLPPQVKSPKHNPDAYLALVKEFIFIGHVHQFTVHERIIAPGSFDRLCHGEEKPKGHVRAIMNEKGGKRIRFVETTGAKVFNTINCIDLTTEETMETIDLLVRDYPPGSYFRIEANYDNPIFNNMMYLVSLYPLFTFSKLVRNHPDDQHEVRVDEIENDDYTYTPITITAQNIEGLILNRLNNQLVPDPSLSNVQLILREILV